jgi:hypothetical protein
VAADIDAAFGNWLAGFIDGEGSFLIGRSAGGSAWCNFRLAVRDDDGMVLEQIAERTGLGNVTYLRRLHTYRQACWYVGSKADCRALVDILDAHPLRAKKARDYAIWREAVFLWGTCRSGVKQPPEFFELRERLMAGRRYVEV